MKSFNELSEQEILALAISLEEEDERVYADFAEGFRQEFPATAAVFDGMRLEESSHRRRLIELYRERFGEHIPLIRRQDVKGQVILGNLLFQAKTVEQRLSQWLSAHHRRRSSQTPP
jgi:rubrerythrin